MNRSKSKKTYEQVAEQIKWMIEQGHLQPGDKLPPMNELAIEFGVSRPTVREAFSTLVGMGLIDLRHGEGTFVQKIDVQTMITEPMNAALLLGRGKLRELLQVRRLLEVGTVRMACAEASELRLAAVRSALERMESVSTKQTVEERVGADLQFHLAIAEVSGNYVLLNLMNTLTETIRSVVRLVWLDEERAAGLVEEHRALYRALLAGDKPLAERLIVEHLDASERLMEQSKPSL
ncbi:FadR/GntR family transcriptional regulator [Tumebacillus permanentifrigoris]|uniref:GntR family transcriptional repressor for pyruvate dehydrogenase complex n=1 Tax=Tumebacillus permanentifrigoris TaxID=378543 RepID=A0A316D9A6_9BACL|nr:FadR/GntR family transcriptional regulator [Tumebacillus permanentifrigoris]PWK13755.1 GntR family transcriptional repressor for pyruvate dehydrogenase complex [Tumebacillus permanentifrigoris]